MSFVVSQASARAWPDISAGLIRGAVAVSFKHDHNRDPERLRILIFMTLWAIWKSRNKNSIRNQDAAANETREVLKHLLSDMVRKSWNATHFIEGDRGFRS